MRVSKLLSVGIGVFIASSACGGKYRTGDAEDDGPRVRGSGSAGNAGGTGGQWTGTDPGLGGFGALGGTAGSLSTGGRFSGTGAVSGTGGTGNFGGREGRTFLGDCDNPTKASDLAQYRIDNFADGDLELPEVDGRSGSWYVSALDTAMSQIVDGAMYAHSGAEGYPSVGVPLGANGCYDASPYSGIRFKLRSDTLTDVKFVVATPPTTPPPRGSCSDETLALCFDHYGVFLPVYPEWSEYSVSWSQLSQGNWGESGPPGYLPFTEILEIALGVTEIDTALDLWIDDVEFIP